MLRVRVREMWDALNEGVETTWVRDQKIPLFKDPVHRIGLCRVGVRVRA